MADASNYVYYANGNAASQPMLEEDVIGDPAIYPDAATLGKPVHHRPIRQKYSGRDTACGQKSNRVLSRSEPR